MKIIYTPPVAVTAAIIQPNVPETVNGFIVNTESMGVIEQAIYNSLSKMWSEICMWFNAQWIKFVDASFIICLSIAFVGAICGVLGIKKGYQVTLLSMVFYCLIRLFSFLMGWY